MTGPGAQPPAPAAGEPQLLTRALPVDPAGLAGARRALSAWLTTAEVANEDVHDVLLASNEACMNAVEHSGAPADGTIGLTARLDGRTLRVEVRDGGAWREPVERPDRGHGLGLMERVMDAVHIQRDREGTRVTMEKVVTLDGAAAQAEMSMTATGPPAVSVTEVDGVAVIAVAGELDSSNVAGVAAKVDAQSGPAVAAAVVDLSALTYLDSSGLHMLFKLARRRGQEGNAVRVVAPPGPVRRVFDMTGVQKALPVDDTVAAAVAATAA